MEAPRFGTDGVRGVANVEVTAEFALLFARAVAAVLAPDVALIGRDTRRSGPMLEAALAAGFAAEGVDVRRLGVCPTPTVAWGAARSGPEPSRVVGVVVSASHNPFEDNGLKVFASGGRKLTDAEQTAIEAAVAAGVPATSTRSGRHVGTITSDPELVEAWIDSVTGSIDGRRLDGLTVVVDAGHGAAYRVAPEILRRLGAEIVVLGAEPDGCNINEGRGSTDTAALRDVVVATGAHAGVAFDGDADRLVAVDADGREIDGDQLLAMCAIDRSERGLLRGETVVATVMANLGLRIGMAARGITVRETPVGDRHVLEALEAGGWTLGGEQSGHLVFRDLATTGDGVLSAVQVLDLLARSGRTIAELADTAMHRLPQVLRNVTVQRDAAEVVAALRAEIDVVAARLGTQGRVLVRPSGTEPVVRVMAEAADLDTATAAVAELVAAVERVVG
ncbi:MAG: phosphoglucosamine mutase [Actinobacteria bacterium]|nr:phosphoglucosamine mutase [Actinomycetota bacterium]